MQKLSSARIWTIALNVKCHTSQLKLSCIEEFVTKLLTSYPKTVSCVTYRFESDIAIRRKKMGGFRFEQVRRHHEQFPETMGSLATGRLS